MKYPSISRYDLSEQRDSEAAFRQIQNPGFWGKSTAKGFLALAAMQRSGLLDTLLTEMGVSEFAASRITKHLNQHWNPTVRSARAS